MQLKKFTFEKFRSIKEKITFYVYDFSILIGQNGGGKTASIDALNLFLKPNLNIAIKDINSSFKAEDLEIIFSGQFALFESEIEFFNKFKEFTGDVIKLYKKFTIKNKPTYFIKAKGTGTKLDNLDLGRYKEPYMKLLDKYEIEYDTKISVNEMKIKLEEKRDTYPKDKIVQIKIPNKELMKILPKYIYFSSESPLDPKKEMVDILKTTLRDQIQELNLDKPVQKIKTKVIDVCNQKISDANNSIKKYCTEIEKIKVLPDYDVLGGLVLGDFNIIKKGGNTVPFDSEATGIKKQIMLGLYEWLNLQITEGNNNTFIFAFDEPDLHFDYIQISNLLSIFHEFSKKDNIQVLIATHSLKLIDNFPPNKIIHFMLNDNKETEINFITESSYDEFKDFLRDISLSIGFRSAFLFFEKVIVITEGPSEYRAFPILFNLFHNKTHFEVGISFINAENNIQGLIFAKYLKNNKKRVILIVDKDSKKKKDFTESNLRKFGFERNKDFFLIGKDNDSEGELEGEFTSEQWVSMLNDKLPKEDGTQWLIKEIEEIRKDGKISKAIKNLIEEKCNQSVSKPNLAQYMAKSITDPNDVSSNLKTILKKINDLTIENG